MNKTEQIFILNPSGNQPPSTSQKLADISLTHEVNITDEESICRICAAGTQFCFPIFAAEGLQNDLAGKIHKHLPIQVSEKDGLPNVMCFQCASTLLAWHELVKCCVQADEALRSRLSVSTAIRQTSNVEIKRKIKKETLENKWKACKNRVVREVEEHRADSVSKDICEIGIEGCMHDDDDSIDDQPLSEYSRNNSKNAYKTFYQALVNFRNHYVTGHNSQEVYPDFTDSSDSEALEHAKSENENANCSDDNINRNLDTFDDLTQSNMRKDRLDDVTRSELNQVQHRLNGKVYYTCMVCNKNLSSTHTYLFHKRIHTGERPCICHVCGKQFRAPNGLQRHLTETHDRVRRHSCRLCPKNFANSQNLKQHLRIHTGERPYVCPHCGKRFTQSGSLHVHLKTHSSLFPHHCAECGAKFRLRSGLARHGLKHTGERPHVCAHCGKGFRQKHELNSHVISHTDAKPHGCVLCGVAFKQRRALRHHIKRFRKIRGFVEGRDPPQYSDTSRVTCGYCTTELLETTLKDHLVAAHADSLFQCDDCDTYVDRKDFITHMSHHALKYAKLSYKEPKKTKKPKKESEIDKKKPEVNNEPILTKPIHDEDIHKNLLHNGGNEFSDHSDTEDGFGPLPNSVFEAIEDTQDSQSNGDEMPPAVTDSKIFPTPPSSEISKPITRPPDKKKSHKKIRTCPVCSKVYSASSSFFYHMKHYHRKSKEHECDVCGKKFGTKAILVQHGYTHTGECLYVCKTCGKRFKSKASHYIHEQIHNGVKRHACLHCHHVFRWKTHLIRHMQRHATEKAHVCTTCGRGFNIRGDLLRHARTHTAGNFACAHCGLNFAQLRYLKVHMHNKHSANSTP